MMLSYDTRTSELNSMFYSILTHTVPLVSLLHKGLKYYSNTKIFFFSFRYVCYPLYLESFNIGAPSVLKVPVTQRSYHTGIEKHSIIIYCGTCCTFEWLVGRHILNFNSIFRKNENTVSFSLP
jgi:hypothetical protein